MHVLVDHRSIKIQVKDIAELSSTCVCRRCKGSGEVSNMIYYNPSAGYRGGLYYVTNTNTCPVCEGRGYWKVPQQ